jgi:hypothetical protein
MSKAEATNELRVKLYKAIRKVVFDGETCADLCYVGDHTVACMVDAAMLVLVVQGEHEKWCEENR